MAAVRAAAKQRIAAAKQRIVQASNVTSANASPTNPCAVESGWGSVLQPRVWQTWTTSDWAASSSATWTGWVTNANAATITLASGTSITSGATWGSWNAYPQWLTPLEDIAQMPALTPEQLAAEAARIEAAKLAWEQRIREAERAKHRAETLLREHLSAKQAEQLTTLGYFELDTIGANGERKHYRIARGRAGNITEVDATGRPLRKLCVHPTENVPDADTMLAQKLWLETDEPALVRVANVSAVR